MLLAHPTTIRCSLLSNPVVGSGTVVEEISTPTRASIIVATSAEVELMELVGQPAVVSIPADAHHTRSFPLVVTSAEASDLDTAAPRYALVLEHPVALLRLRRDHRTFLEMSVQSIVGKVLAVLGLTIDWRASRGKSPRTVCVQYGETDYDFFARLLEEEGIFWFSPDDEAAPKLVAADASTAFTAIAGKTDVPLAGETVSQGSSGGALGITEISLVHSVTTGAVALADFDYEKPGVDLTSRAQLDDAPAGELFEYPGRYRTQSDGAALAKIRAEELASDKVVASGTSTRAHLQAATWFNLTSEAGDAPIGKYVVRRVEHTLDPERYENSFTASPLDLPFRPKRRAAAPRALGASAATVTGPAGQEIHTDKLGRMTALYAFDRIGKKDDTSSQWIRVLQPALGGSMMLARVGWEMAIRHLEGDPDRPVAVARMYDGEHVPPSSLPDAKTKTSFETLTSPKAEKINAITIDDKSGAMLMEVKAAKDLDLTILHDENETIGANDELTIGKDSTTLIGDAQTVMVEKDDAHDASKDAGVAVAGDRTKKVKKDETATVEGGLSIRIDGNDEAAITKDLTVTSDKEMLERTQGAWALKVGGARTSKAKKDYTIYIAGKSAETVGAAKTVTSSDGPLRESVGGNVTVSVGGALVETVDGNCVSSAEGAVERSVGAVGSLTATGKVMIKGKTIKLNASGAVTFLGGGGAVSLTPASVALVGVVSLKGSGGVEISGVPQMAG